MSDAPAPDPSAAAGDPTTPPPPSSLPLVMMLLSSVAASISLGMLSYTFATGALPFGVQPLIRPQEPAPAAAGEAADAKAEQETMVRPGEHYAWRLYEAIEKKRTEVEEEQARLAEERRVVEELFRSVDLREAELRRLETRIAGLLDRVDETEVANVKQIGGVLAQADGKAAADMLLAMDQDLAARVLYFMDPKKSGELITAIQKTGDASKEKAVELLEKLQQISREPAT